MLNTAFLWMVNEGIELGVIILCLIVFRAMLRRIAPRIFSYVFWSTLPVMVLCELVFLVKPELSVQRPIQIYFTSQMEVKENCFGVLKVAWMAGGVLMLAVLFLSYFQFRRCLIGSIRLRNNIYLASRITTPFTLGLFWPKIYLPTSIEQKYHDAVILHEEIHIRRKDVWVKNFALLFLALFWFQPLLWLAYGLFINDMEEACDEAVLREKGVTYSAEYARALVEVSYQAGRFQGVAVGYGAGEVKKRVNNILRYKRTKLSVCVATFLCLVLFVVLMLPLSWSVPQTVKRELPTTGSHPVVVEQSEIQIEICTGVEE